MFSVDRVSSPLSRHLAIVLGPRRWNQLLCYPGRNNLVNLDGCRQLQTPVHERFELKLNVQLRVLGGEREEQVFFSDQ